MLAADALDRAFSTRSRRAYLRPYQSAWKSRIESGIAEEGIAGDITRTTDLGVALKYVSSTKMATSIAGIEINGSSQSEAGPAPIAWSRFRVSLSGKAFGELERPRSKRAFRSFRMSDRP